MTDGQRANIAILARDASWALKALAGGFHMAGLTDSADVWASLADHTLLPMARDLTK